MLKPTVFGGTVPMFHFCRDGDYFSRCELYGRLSPFLIPTATGYANQYLNAFMVDMPVISAARFKSYIGGASSQRCKITVAIKILCIVYVGFPDGPCTVIDAFS